MRSVSLSTQNYPARRLVYVHSFSQGLLRGTPSGLEPNFDNCPGHRSGSLRVVRSIRLADAFLIEIAIAAGTFIVGLCFECAVAQFGGKFISSGQHSGDLNLIKPLVHVPGRCKIPHGRLQRSVPHPTLHGSDIEAKAKHAGGIGRPEGLQIELRRIKIGTPSNFLAAIEHVPLPIASRRRKYQPGVLPPRMACKETDESLLDRDLALFPALRPEPKVWLGRDPHRVEREAYVPPEQVDHLLLSETSEEERREERPLPWSARRKKLLKIGIRVFERQGHHALGEPEALRHTRLAAALQELGDDDHLVDYSVVVELVLVLQPDHEIREIVPGDLAGIGVRRQEFHETVEDRLVLAERVRFLERLAFYH
jgi:hypothetical protein